MGQSTFFQYFPHAKGLEIKVRPFGDGSLERTTVSTWLGQRVTETHPESAESIHYAYNSRGLLENRYQGAAANPTTVTRFVYDGLGRVRETWNRQANEAHESLVTTFSYDVNNRMSEAVQYTDGGLPVTYTYKDFDDANRLTGMRITLPQLDGTSLEGVGAPFEMMLGERSYELAIAYDEIGRERWFQHPEGAYESYGYHYYGQPESVYYGFGPNHPEGPVFEHLIEQAQYNPYSGQLVGAVWDQGGCDSEACGPALQRMGEPVSRDEQRRPELDENQVLDVAALSEVAERGQESGMGVLNTWWPDSMGRAVTVQLFPHGGNPEYLYRRLLTIYNEWGFIESFSRDDRLFPSRTEIRHAYTDRGQLHSFSVGNEAITYGYDQVGNLTSRSGMSFHTGTSTLAVASHSASFGQGNRFHRDGGYTYDVQGRLTQTPNHSVRYNRAGQISQVLSDRRVDGEHRSGSGDRLFLYDAFGQRVAAVRENTQTVTYSIRHADGRIITEEDFPTGAGNQLKQRRQYVTLQGKAIFVEKEDFENGKPTRLEKIHFFRDCLGNPVVTWNGETNAVTTAAYEPYGQPLIEAARHKGAHGFTGHDEDPNGLIYMGARFYDPVAGCFTQPDRARDFNPYLPNSYNLYTYTHQNPVSGTDPNGNAVETAWDVLNIGIGVASFAYNVREGNWLDAAIDAGGVVVDGLAAAVPVVPGGAGTALKILRTGEKIVDTGTDLARAADKANDAKKAANAADNAGDAANVTKNPATKRRVKLRKETRKQIEKNQPRNERGKMIDPHSKEPLKPGEIDVGHKPGQEWRKRRKGHDESGSTRKEVIEAENDPALYHLEDRASNRSHRHEDKRL
ncbi:hypothetical protein J3U87_17465 [Sulfidibacter corallicola]|uniref:RHS repeat-associated core domain-containing protein n=2 Tax=Sulfidibacter corallicola TaxID=2818388 RepID=A0A8A4TW99_SULCO|nr:hypothetical protein J3U87_17465 [Sulfidibacter corallicola]